MLFDWMKKLHTYAGLLSYAAMVVWGITGIHAVFLPAPDAWREPAPTSVRRVAWVAPGNLDDAALAEAMLAASDLRMVGQPVLRKRDAQHNLGFAVFGPNGRRDLRYLEEQQVLVVEERQNSVVEFLSVVHAGSTRRGPPDAAARVWGFYNEMANWSLVFLTLSGLYLWLATRPRLRWAWMTFGAAMLSFVALWLATR